MVLKILLSLIDSYFTIFCFGLAILVKVLLKHYERRKLHLPPGPAGLPFLGYLPFLGSKPYKQFTKLSKKYGNVIGVKLGGRLTVVLTDLASIKEAFSNNDFSARPDGLFKINDIYDNVVNMRGKQWVEHTRFNNTIFRNLGMGKEELEDVIKEQVSRIVYKLENLPAEEDRVNLQSLLSLSADNVIYSMICGKTYPEGDTTAEIIHQYQINILKYFSGSSLILYFPWLKPILKLFPFMKRLKTAITNFERIINSEINRHEKNQDLDHPVDYVDHFLREIKSKKSQHGFDKIVLNGNAQLFMLAGSETGRVTVEWALMLLAKHRDVQEKAFREISEVIGTERLVSYFKDRDSLPYTFAVMMESQRRITTLPLCVPRCAQRQTKLFNYDIPKETLILASLWSVHNDPVTWPDPKKFDPGRFLSEDGKKIVIHEHLISFSYGHRICPGEKMANMQFFTSLTTLIQKFEFLPPEDGLDFSKILSLTCSPKNSLLRVRRR